jgi:protein-tyrosine phosphatase
VSETFDVLVVCLGNLCRSPLAERLLRLRLADSRGVRVSSAGVRAVVGAPMDASAALELTRLGGDPSDFVARQLTAELVTDADLVLAATRQLRSQVVELAPTALRRTFTLRELAALLEERPWPSDPADLRALVTAAADWRGSVADRDDALDVPDPIGGPASLHREAAELAAAATDVVAGELSQRLHLSS